MFENFISKLCYTINYQIKVTAGAQSVSSCIRSSKDFQVIPFLHPITRWTLQTDFFFNQLTPGNKWDNCPSASKAPGCCWWQGNRLNRFHIFMYNQNSLTAEPSRQTRAPPGVPMCFLPPLCLPAGAIQPPARLQGAALPSSLHGGAAPGCGNQTGRGIPTQGSTSGAFLNQLCSCSVSHDEMLREREEKSHSKIPWGGRDREKNPKIQILWSLDVS